MIFIHGLQENGHQFLHLFEDGGQLQDDRLKAVLPTSGTMHLDLLNMDTTAWFNIKAITIETVLKILHGIFKLDICGLTNLAIDNMDQDQVTTA